MLSIKQLDCVSIERTSQITSTKPLGNSVRQDKLSFLEHIISWHCLHSVDKGFGACQLSFLEHILSWCCLTRLMRGLLLVNWVSLNTSSVDTALWCIQSSLNCIGWHCSMLNSYAHYVKLNALRITCVKG